MLAILFRVEEAWVHTLANHRVNATPKQPPDILCIRPFAGISVAEQPIDIGLHALLPRGIQSQADHG